MNYKRRIKEKGLKIVWIAKKVGVSQPMISQVINGTRNLSVDKEYLLKKLLE